jgi:hypothetical protein
VKKLPHVAAAVDPFSKRGASQISEDKQTAFIPVLLDVGGDELTQELAESVLDVGNPARHAGLQVAVGGSAGSELSEPATEKVGQCHRLRRDDRRDRADHARGRHPARDGARLLVGSRGRDSVLAAITLLPAVLSLVGRHIESLRLPAFLRPKPKEPEGGFWGGWAHVVTTRPWWAIGVALAVLIPLIIPFLSLNLGQEDLGATPKSTTGRQA